jgi:SAM-dependent methyltransferase
MSAVAGTVAPGNLYDKVATKNAVERRMVDGFAAALESLLPEKAERILDVGCGEGHHMRSVGSLHPEAVMTGIDIADASWLAAWHRDPAEADPIPGQVATGDATALPFAGDSFDLVLALEVLEHLTDPRAAVAEIARVATDTVVISVPWEPMWRAGNLLRGRYVTALGNTPGHLQHFTRRRLLRMISEHFVIEAIRRPLPWTFVRARVKG